MASGVTVNRAKKSSHNNAKKAYVAAPGVSKVPVQKLIKPIDAKNQKHNHKHNHSSSSSDSSSSSVKWLAKTGHEIRESKL